MNDLLLAMDIGNTTIECGIFKGDRLTATWHLSSEVERTADELRILLAGLLREAGFEPPQIEEAAISSVVPDKLRIAVETLQGWYGRRPLVVSIDSCPFLDVRCDDPRQVGADRICNGYAGFHLYGGPLVAVDFGTATTLDVVAADGGYLGGIILAGPITAARALHRRTAQLPLSALNFPEDIIGRNTDHAIQSGLTWGMVDMIDGLLKRIADRLGRDPVVVATGGLAAPFAERSLRFTHIHPHLVLEGIRLIHKRWRDERAT